MTLKLTPSLPSADGEASVCPLVVIMVNACAFADASVSCVPFTVAYPPVNPTVPKLSSGTKLPEPPSGISSTQSADESDDAYDTLV